jgi:hypothetical protein
MIKDSSLIPIKFSDHDRQHFANRVIGSPVTTQTLDDRVIIARQDAS